MEPDEQDFSYDYESLRLIMQDISGREVNIKEARRVGNDLMEFFGALLGRENKKLENSKDELSEKPK